MLTFPLYARVMYFMRYYFNLLLCVVDTMLLYTNAQTNIPKRARGYRLTEGKPFSPFIAEQATESAKEGKNVY